ncbi:MAG: hypothetical protein IJO94_02235, partial [Firmicutes bacterium]|nr:hypothetical protein [Bacillota bacterium]
ISLVFLGLVLVAFGVLWGGDAVNLWDFDVFFPGWWSLILIIMPIFGMVRHGVKWFDIVIMCIGFLILISYLGIINWHVVRLLFFPALVVFIGLVVIFSVFKKKPSPRLDREAAAKVFASFGSVKKNCDGQIYDGGRVDAEFGSMEFDLRNAIIERDIMIRSSATFGTVKIWLPPNVRVLVEDTSVLGSMRDHSAKNNAVNVPVVHICGRAFCGTIELY